MFRMLPSSGHLMTLLIVRKQGDDVTMQKYINVTLFDTFLPSSIKQYDREQKNIFIHIIMAWSGRVVRGL